MPRFRKLAVGATVREIGRIGKRVVVHLDRPWAIVFEPRMSGLVLLADPPTIEHLRFRVSLSGGGTPELLYWDRRGLGSVRLILEADLAERYNDSAIGPDALQISADELAARLSAAVGQSKSRCSTSGRSPASVICMRPRFFI